MSAFMLDKNNKVHHSKNGHRETDAGKSPVDNRPDPQVVAAPVRRRFTAEYKRRIIKEADACVRHGELGELLRREGIYASTLAKFRSQLAAGRLDQPEAHVRDAERKQKEAARQRDLRRIASLESENQKLRALIDLQKKLSDLIGVPLLTERNE
jgi:transposase-like protein